MPPAEPRALGLSLLGLLAAIAGPVAAFSFLDHAWLRSTMALGFLGTGLGALLGIRAWRDRRWLVRAVATMPLLIATLWCAFALVALQLPAPSATELAAAPDFTLPDQTGKGIGLAAARATGPVLLVFYRGHW